ncbi:MAG: TMEM175 family protein [Chthoniobacterales bacterium]
MTVAVSPRQEEIESTLPADLDALPRLDGFRLRGMQMTRLETFIDAAFAFAITMLVMAAQQILDDIATLLAAFRNVPTFIFSIFVIGIFWRAHWLWNGRYGLEDGVSIFVSWAMLVTILIYIYPLKAVFESMFFYLTRGRFGQTLGPSTVSQVRTLFVVYSSGSCSGSLSDDGAHRATTCNDTLFGYSEGEAFREE